MAPLEHLWNLLGAGRIEEALGVAEELFIRSPEASTNAQEAGEFLAREYREKLRVGLALRFEEEIAPALGPAAEVVLEPLREELSLFHTWRDRLASLAAERLAEEFVGAVKARDLRRAFELARNLLDTATQATQRTQRARQIGNLLGGIVAGKERVAEFVRQLASRARELGLDAGAVAAMVEEYERAAVAVARRETHSASATRVELTQAIVEMARALPDRMALHEPRDEECERFERVVRAIVAASVTSPGFERFHEATLLFVEFVPKQLSSTGALAGVEQRLYSTLGRTARLVASRTFAKFGALDEVWRSYETFADRAIRHSRIAPLIVEVVGLWRNPKAVALLIEWANDARLGVRPEALAALGTIATRESSQYLLKVFSEAVRGRVVTGDARRDALVALDALARAARSWHAAARSDLMRRLVKMLPPREFELALRTALAFLQGSLEGMDAELLRWSATVATQALWHIDRPELAAQGRSAPLGFRQPLIDLLERLAPYALDTINQVALEQAKTFCGAYLALGELYAKLADPQTLPVLRQLILNTFLYDDKPKSPYQRETVLEPGTEERSQLTRDKVLASLVYAVSKIPGEEAEELLAELFEKVRSGHLPQPGRETADILMQAAMKRSQKRGGGPFGIFPGAQPEQQGEQAPEVTTLSAEETRWLHDLEARFFLASKRRAARVAAMAQLAQRRTLAALPRIIEHLTDKDPIIAAAASTALLDYARAPASPRVLERLHTELLGALRLGNESMRRRVAELLTRLGPKRTPLKERLQALLDSGGLDASARRIVEQLLEGQTTGTQLGAQAATATPEAQTGATDAPSPSRSRSPHHISALEKRRQYLLARQAWIRGGKKGPEPQPPE